ncbi:helix-turn-helix domain-containing protein [Algibacter mikhailovii]|uniref:helix-turn-helix domain-containing protein n=1 Tax=Algibacter mikhailovii TaxID=425498 RepID=UPI002495662E|nr:AraC family transcriptional regulator [Algibacter mikhailovii]
MQNYLASLKLNLLNIGFASLDSKWDFDNVISPFTRLYLITSGNAYVYHNNMKFELKAGYMYLIPSNTYSRYKCNSYHEQYYISFIEEVINGLSTYNIEDFEYELKANELDRYHFKRLLEINPNRVLINNAPSVYHNKPLLFGVSEKDNDLSTSHFVESIGILKILFSRFIRDVKHKDKPNGKSEVVLENTLVYIAEHLHKELTISELASFNNLSKDHFSRNFFEKFGIRPNKYIQSKRVERAQLLLLTTDDSLLEIAEKVGFLNISYFSKIFKKFTGRTPTHFRKEQMKV